jgi:hypothetical protein
MSEAEVFERIYQDYIEKVFRVDLEKAKNRLGLEWTEGVVDVPIFGSHYRITPQGITDPKGNKPPHSISVILCQYVLLCPETEPEESGWVTFKDFKDAGPFAVGFRNNAERPISKAFSGQLEALADAGRRLGGRPFDVGTSSDLVFRFEALPKIPILLLFNDRDEDFPAQCSLLFERRAEKYLDMECLAMVGWALAEWMKRLVPKAGKS